MGASAYIKSGDQYVKHCGDFNQAKRQYDFLCVGSGDAVEVSQEGNVVEWNLAEIQIFGRPLLPPGLKKGCLVYCLHNLNNQVDID